MPPEKPTTSGFALIVFRLIFACLLSSLSIMADAAEEVRTKRMSEDSGLAGVVDGDGLILNGKEHRLFGIDAVELDQGCTGADNKVWKCGQEAARFLNARVNDQRVTCQWSETDRYRRRLSTCKVNGEVLNSALVSEGFAVAYRKYSSLYVEQEIQAMQQSKGIWAGHFLMPWEHRAGGDKVEIESPYKDKTIKGNISRKGRRLYHCRSDKSYDNTKITEARGERWFATVEEAEAAGWARASTFGQCKI